MGHYLIEKLKKYICNLLYNLTCSLSNYFNIHTLFKVDNSFFPSRSTILKVAEIQKLNKPQKSQTETGRLFVWSKTSPNWTMEFNHCGSVQSEASSHAFVCQRRCWAALRQSVRELRSCSDPSRNMTTISWAILWTKPLVWEYLYTNWTKGTVYLTEEVS